jgi:hypothetical protein
MLGLQPGGCAVERDRGIARVDLDGLALLGQEADLLRVGRDQIAVVTRST